MGTDLNVVIAHNPAGEEDDPSTSDVLAQVELVESGLAELGLPSVRLAVDPGRTLEVLRKPPGNLIFNLIESPAGRPWIDTDSAAVLELAGLPYTGSSPAALALTTDKIATRALLASEGVAVAPGGRLDLKQQVGAGQPGDTSVRAKGVDLLATSLGHKRVAGAPQIQQGLGQARQRLAFVTRQNFPQSPGQYGRRYVPDGLLDLYHQGRRRLADQQPANDPGWRRERE